MNSIGEIAKNLFSKADLNNDNILDKDEMRKIMKQMQINIDNKTFNQKFEAFDKDKNGVIDKKEFNHFIETLMRKPELLPLFKKYASQYNGVDDTPVMTPQELVRFYKEEQKMEIVEQEALEIIENLKKGSVSSYPSFEKINRMSFYDFSALIFSSVNLIFNSEHVNVYQDMTRPLTDYYMNSSHNTYLDGNQLTSDSNIKSYIRALELGCRSVEIDLWNGENAEPIVTHGHTLTSKIYFKDLIVALKEHAFVRNEYPLVFSFEMHCDLKGQQKIAQILESEIKDQIFVLPQDYETMNLYPSPESLKRKFVIKSKGEVPFSLYGDKSNGAPLNTGIELYCEDDDEPHLDIVQLNRMFNAKASTMPKSLVHGRSRVEEEEKNSAGENVFKRNYEENANAYVHNQIKHGSQFLHSELADKQNSPTSAQRGSLTKENGSAIVTETGDVKIKVKKQKKTKSFPGLAKYFTMFGIKMKLKVPRSIWNISSLSEEKIKSLLKHSPREFTDFCKKYFVRVYPLGTRVDSSNYDPIKSWIAGAQMVALNCQTSCESMLLNYAKYAANGSAGYILKPEYLTSATILDKSKANYPYEFTKPKLKLTLKIISGQQFQFEKENVKDIIDPFVEVKLRGIELDEELNKVYRTHTIQDNGFNPVWSTETKSYEVEYNIIAPELATLVVKVFDGHLTKNTKLAWYAIDVPHIVSGHRVLPMLNARYDPWPQCYLYVHVKVEHLS